MEKNWNEKELLEFIVEASRNTYADPEARTLEVPYRPNCEEYLYEKNGWRYLDSYAWKNDGGGEEIVYRDDVPVWLMNYYGFLIGEPDGKQIYAFLHEALRERHPLLPVRGAPLLRNGFRYEIEFGRHGIDNFLGTERIFQNDALAYEGYFHGGYVK